MKANSQGKVLVIGGTGYLGSGIVKELAQNDVQVVFSYCHNHEAAEILTRETLAPAAHLDLSSEDSVQAFVNQFSADPIESIIFCVGPKPELFFTKDAQKYNFTDWKILTGPTLQLEFNKVVGGFVSLVQKLQASLAQGRSKNILVLTSLEGLKTKRSPLLLATVTGALRTTVESLAFELGGQGIKINSLGLSLSDGGTSNWISKELRADFIKHSARGREIRADEVAKVVRFMALENSYMTGQTIALDGGL